MRRAFLRLLLSVVLFAAGNLFGAAPTITSFTPTSGSTGTSVTLTGTNFTGATTVKFNGVVAGSFSVTSSTKITAVAPTGVTTGKINVTTPRGTSTSSSSFTKVAAPTLTSFTPTSGAAGTSVTLTGTVFTGATAVKFNGTTAGSFTVNSATKITAVAPTGITTGKITVTTAGGTATSSASFTIATAPLITTQPSSRTVTLGSTATFTVVATGTATLTYQWSKNGVPISGATLTSYTTPATVIADNGSTYTVKVTNSIGNITSSVATLTLNLPPAITSQPANQIVNVGSTASFTVVATGTGSLTFQWSKNGTSISGATSASYTIPAVTTGDNAKSFTVKVTNTYGNVTSAAAILTVTVPPPTKPVVTAPNAVTANQSGYLATVPTQAGCTYAWTIRGGAIAAGSTTSQITFTPSGPGAMAVARTAHAAVSLPDGRVLVTGGIDGSSTVLTSAEIYNPDQGGFSPTPTSMASARQNHTATLLMDGRVLIVGGFDQNYACLASAEIFDPTTGQFSVAPGALAAARGAMTATLLPSGKVLLVGGWNSGIGGLSSAELFDPISGTFSGSMTTMVSARFSHTATPLANGTVLIAGGSYNGPYPLATAEIFDPTTNAFHSTIGSMTSERQSHTASLLSDGRVLLAGGHDGISSLFSAECFDPVTGLFSGIASQMGSARSHHTAALLPSGQVLLAGGSGPEGSLAGGELFDPLGLVFTAASGNMSVAREGFTATPTSNGQILLVGGVNSSSVDGTSTTLPSFDFYESSTALLGYMSTSLTCTVTNSLGSASQPGTLKVLVLRAISTSTITTKSSVITGRGGYTASVPTQYGCTYTWTITNGTITNGAGTSAVIFSAGAVGTTLKLTCVVANAAGSSKTANATLTVAPAVLTLTPLTVLLSPGGQQAFTANQPVVWDFDSGSISYTSTSATYKASRNGTNLDVGTYTLTATSKADSSMSVSAYITVFVTGSPIIDSFSASPGFIHAGQPTTLSWSVSNATGVNLDPYAGPLNGNSIAVTPTQETTYTLSASNELGTVTSRLTVGVDLVPSIADFTANPSTVNVGGTTQFFANYTNGTGQISPGAQPIQSGATAQVQPKGITVYTLAVTNPYGAMATRDAQVDVTGPGAFLPTLDLASPQPSAMSTRLSDGRVCLMGGSPPYETQVQLFNPETGGFQLGGPLQGGRARGTATHLADDKVLLWGGAVPGSNISFLNGFEVVDPRRGVSSAQAINSGGMGGVNYPNSIVYRCDHSATRLADGRVLIAGGRSLRDGLTYSSWAGDRVSLATTLRVDPNANPGPSFGLNVAGSMITSRADHVAIRLLDGRVLVAGGTHVEGQPGTMYYSETTLTSSELFDPVTGTWTAAGDLNDGRNAQNPVLLPDGRVVFDGREVFDPATLTFTLLPAPYKGFSGFGTEALLLPDGRILMSSGYAHAGPLLYNPANNLCTGVTAPNPSGNYLGSGYQSLALLQDGTALLIGGGSPSMARADHLDPQAQLSITPSQGYTNVGVPLPLLATGVRSPGATWNSTGGADITNGTFMSSTVGLFPVTATALDGTKATIMVEVFPAVKVVFGTFTYPGIGAILNAGVPVPFSAHVQNTPDQRLIWSVQEGQTAGTITADGVFTAASVGTWHIVATSVADPTQSAMFTLTTAPPIALSIQPQQVSALPGQNLTFTITEPSGQTRVSVNAPGIIYPYYQGTITYQVPTVHGTYNLLTTSTLDSTKTASATITVVPVDSMSITPANPSIVMFDQKNFQAFVTSSLGIEDVTADVTWSSSGGTFSPIPSISNYYSAPATPGTYTIQAVLNGTTLTASTTVQVLPIEGFAISPSRYVMATGESVHLRASARGGQSLHFTPIWSCTGGSIDSYSQIYTAPAIPGTYLVQAVVPGTTISATAKMMVVTPDAFTTNGGGTQVSRDRFTMTRLLDGRILILGGGNNSAEMYDPATKAFSPITATMAQARSQHSATLLPDGKVLIVGGLYDYGNPQPKIAELFDPSTQTFAVTSGSPLYQRSDHSSTLLPNGMVLLAGGSDAYLYRSLEVYDPSTESFSSAGFLNNAFRASTGASVLLADGRVLFTGPGLSGPDLAEMFDYKTSTATSINAMNGQMHSGSSLIQASDGMVWSLGGNPLQQDASLTTEWFDPQLNQFSLAQSLPMFSTSGGYRATELVDGSIYWFDENAYTDGRFLYLDTGLVDPARPFPTSLIGHYGHPALLQSGELLRVGYKYNASVIRASALIVADITPNAVILPRRLTLVAGRSWPFQASSTGLGNAGFTWSIQEGASGGSITSQGVYTAPFQPGAYHIVATSLADASIKASAIAEVIQDVGVFLSPALIQLSPGAIHTFTADAIGAVDPSVTWSARLGTITSQGVYTAPATEGNDTITATSVENPSRSAMATVVVKTGNGSGGVPLPIVTAFTSDTLTVAPGQPAHLSWNVIGAYRLQLNAQDVTGLSGITVRPTITTQYQLLAMNPAGAVHSQALTITVSTTPVTIGVTPQSATLYVGQPLQFGFSLSAPTNRVTWACTGGNITQTGLYTAPATPGGSVVTITSVDDPSKSAHASVTVLPPIVVPVSVQISPVTLDIYTSRTSIFGASVSAASGSSTGVTWTTTAGKIVSLDGNSGYFTAPDVAGTCIVTAISVADPTKTSSCVVNVKSASVTLSISPVSVELGAGESFKFGSSLQVVGSTVTSLTWSTDAGTILSLGDGSALYKAPLEAGTYRVSVISNANPKVFATAMVTVNPAKPFLMITPSEVRLSIGATQSFSAQGSMSSGPVQWSIVESGGGAIDANGLYNAPITRGTYTVVAVASTTGGFIYATAKVTVGSLVIQAPSELTLFPGGSYAFAASQQNGSSSALTWSIDEGLIGGTITSGGTYTAPQQAGYYHVRVSDSGGLSDVKEVLVTLIDAIGISPKVEILEEGDYVLSVSLQASNGKRAGRSASLHLGVGMQEPELTFSADRLKTDLGVDGPYLVVDVRIEKSTADDRVPADSPKDLGATAAYRLNFLERPWITAGGVVAAEALDLNGNGLADQLRVSFDVTLVAMGNYTWSGALVDGDGLVIGHAYGGPSPLPSGPSRLSLIFSGTVIQAHGKDGPYYLRNLLLQGPVLGGSGNWSGAITGFRANQFEVPIIPPAAATSNDVHATLPPPQKGAAKQTEKKGVNP